MKDQEGIRANRPADIEPAKVSKKPDHHHEKMFPRRGLAVY
jgi:hypothetical protein